MFTPKTVDLTKLRADFLKRGGQDEKAWNWLLARLIETKGIIKIENNQATFWIDSPQIVAFRSISFHILNCKVLYRRSSIVRLAYNPFMDTLMAVSDPDKETQWKIIKIFMLTMAIDYAYKHNDFYDLLEMNEYDKNIFQSKVWSH